VVRVRQAQVTQAFQARHPARDDLVRREFSSDAPNQLWLADITEHRTDEGKLYLCAIKDVFSNRIVGWAIDERMKARLTVAALEMAVARRGDVVVIQEPRLDGNELSYSIKLLDGTVPAAAGSCALFIDSFGRPLSPVSAAGMHRRARRRNRRL